MKKIKLNSEFILLSKMLILILVLKIIYFGFILEEKIIYNSDSVTNFIGIDLFNGVVDLYRTPIYPNLIMIFQNLSEANLVRNIIVFQQILSFLSIIPFYYVSIKLLKKKYLVITATLFYGSFNWINNQNVTLNPDCISIVLSVILLYLLVIYEEKPSRLKAAAIGIMPLILVMLKPVYIIAFIIILFYFVMKFILLKNDRTIAIIGIMFWFVSCMGIFGYCFLNKAANGYFTLSKVTLNNDIAKIILSGAYKDGGDSEFIDLIDSNINEEFYYAAVFAINNECVEKFIYELKKFPSYLPLNRDMLFLSRLKDTRNYSDERIADFIKNSHKSILYKKYLFKQFIQFLWKYKTLFLMMMFESYAIYISFRNSGRKAWNLLFCITFVVSHMFVVAFGGIDDWNRLLVPSYPFIILIFTLFFGMIISLYDRKKIVESIL